ncbi:hypothetical protein L7F22_001765 [Adiantum nelumboides]|nr:hypothetical protein [Adiantum nelumboides]
MADFCGNTNYRVSNSRVAICISRGSGFWTLESEPYPFVSQRMKQFKLHCLMAPLLLLALIITLSCTTTTTTTALLRPPHSGKCHPVDQAALLSLAASYHLHNWTEQSTASNAADCCRWQGVTCANTTGPDADGNNTRRVTALKLKGTGLWGDFPPQLCNLTALQDLSLARNGLSGPLPPCITTHLRRLRSLDLSFNFISTLPIPFALPVLHALDLSFNFLSAKASPLSRIAGGGLPSLAILDLTGNFLSGPLPPSLFDTSLLPSLAILHLTLNQFNGSLPSFPSKCSTSNLLFLDLLGSFDLDPATGAGGPIPPSISNLCNLRALIVAFSGLSGPIPEALYTLPLILYLDLEGNNLEGSISSSIRNLHALMHLGLSDNFLSGALPPELGSLANLSELDLKRNNFDPAPFPPFLGNLSQLQYLDLSDNSFNSTIPPEWGNLTHLSTFKISGNTLSATLTLPSWLFRFPLQKLELRSLRLSSTHFSCEKFKLINSTIRTLDISDNNLTASSLILECLSQLSFPSLSHLNLSHNPFQSPLNPSAVLLTPSLSHLDISWCGLSGRLTNSFLSLATSTLTSLTLSHNQLQGKLPSLLPTYGGWTDIDLSHNFFTGINTQEAVVWKINQTSHVQLGQLLLSNNKLRGHLGEFLANFAAFRRFDGCPIRFEMLDVSNNDFTGTVPPFLANCSGLNRIKMGNNHLRGQIPSELGLLSGLRTLSLHHNELEGSIPSTLSNCSSLEVLDLSHNRLEGDVEQALFRSQKLPSLRVLLLSYNRLTGVIPASLGVSSPSLQLIGFSNNRLAGVIPPHLQLPAFKKLADSPSSKRLSSSQGTLFEDDITLVVKGVEAHYTYILNIFTSIDLSGNALSGPIPRHFGEFTGLVYLNLSRNNLSGSIPAELSKLQALESLDFSFNKLTGSIPAELGSLSMLATFNVSFNEGLSGEIPTGTQLQDQSSFLGDDKLCGFPKPDPCVNNKGIADDGPIHHRQRFVEWVQGWASMPGLLLGFIVGFGCTIVALHANWRSCK